MENRNRWNLEIDAVLSAEAQIFGGLKTGTVEELMQKLKDALSSPPVLKDGIPCRVLEPGKIWRQGKVRLVIEFCPDEPEPWS